MSGGGGRAGRLGAGAGEGVLPPPPVAGGAGLLVGLLVLWTPGAAVSGPARGAPRPVQAAVRQPATAAAPAAPQHTSGSRQAAPAQDTAATQATAAAQDTAAARDTAAQGPRGGNCLECHRGLDDERLSAPAGNFGDGVHAETGFGCVACHGGDATATTEAEAHEGFVGAPSKRFVPRMCARCHSNTRFMRHYAPQLATDQLDRYRNSVHGERLFRYGDTAVAVCTSCHKVHPVRPPSDQRSAVHPTNIPETCGSCHADEDHMRPYDVPTDQLSDYRESVHWQAVSERGDLSAPVCNDCHGNHAAAPPGYEWVGNVCGECHSRIAGYFSGSVHDSVFVLLGTPGCATCHDNHRVGAAGDDMLGIDGAGTCGGSGCHGPGGASARPVRRIARAVDSLDAAFEEADSILEVAEEAGMPVSEAQFQLQQGQNTLIRARAITHTASVDSVEKAVEGGMAVADTAYARGQGALAELQWRRKGLGISAAVILVFIAGLVVKIRQVEGSGHTGGGGSGHGGGGPAAEAERGGELSEGPGGGSR